MKVLNYYGNVGHIDILLFVTFHIIDQWTVYLMGALGALVPPPPGRWQETWIWFVCDPQDKIGACQAYFIFQNEGGFGSTSNINSIPYMTKIICIRA